MHIPVIVMLVISVLSLIGLFAIDWNISHGKEQHKEKDNSEHHSHKK
ncbi:MAG: hypothetical protein V3G42_12250 [Oscillospiraceae bacterium]